MSFGNDDAPLWGVQLLQKRHVHQIEEVEQADPDDSGNKVDPAKDDQGGLFASRKVDLRCRKRNYPKSAHFPLQK